MENKIIKIIRTSQNKRHKNHVNAGKNIKNKYTEQGKKIKERAEQELKEESVSEFVEKIASKGMNSHKFKEIDKLRR
ncbi:MAG: hypothetical protein IMZ51_03800 [Chloroflexi bacterium]|nr:hypothetical protein [Chloroflexota bacterium]